MKSEVLWDCLTCNQCLKDCPENINFADLARMARYKMRHTTNKNVEELIAHKGVYTTISEIMSRPYMYLDKIYEHNLRNLLKRCYQCGRCSGVCQLSNVLIATESKLSCS